MARNVAGPGTARRGTDGRDDVRRAAGDDDRRHRLRRASCSPTRAGARACTTPRAARWLWCGAHCGRPSSRWIHQELRGLATQRVAGARALRRGALPARRAAGVRRAARRARVPGRRLGAARSAALRGGLVAAGRRGCAAAPTSRSTRPTTAGSGSGASSSTARVAHDDARACDFTRPRAVRATAPIGAAFDTRTWADGAHALRLGAQDAGGNWTCVARDRARRQHAAARARARARRRRGLEPAADAHGSSVPLPGGQAAPLDAGAGARLCRAGGAVRGRGGRRSCAGPRRRPRWRSPRLDGPGRVRGAGRARGRRRQRRPGRRAASRCASTTRAPGAPDLSAADRWHDGAALPLAAEGEPPVSGIRGYRVRIGGRETLVVDRRCRSTALPEGGTPIEVRAVSGAGVASTAVRTMLKLDRSRPTVDASGVPAPDALVARPGPDRAARPRSGRAVRRALARLGARRRRRGVAPTATRPRSRSPLTGGTRVAYRAVDGAGNASGARHRDGRRRPHAAGDRRVRGARPGRSALVRVVVADAHVRRRRRPRSSCAAPAALGAALPTSLERRPPRRAARRRGAARGRVRAARASAATPRATRRVGHAPRRRRAGRAHAAAPAAHDRLPSAARVARCARRLMAGGRPLAGRELSADRAAARRWRAGAPCARGGR